MIRPKITVKDSGPREFKKFIDSMKHVKGSYVSIGVQDDAGEYENGPAVVEVALWNEFGTERIPERSFFRSTLNEHAAEINKWREDLLGRVMDGKETVDHALNTLGFRIRELIKNKINSNMPPPNAPSTIAAKKHDGVAPRTLVDTTLLLRSIEYRVVVK